MFTHYSSSLVWSHCDGQDDENNLAKRSGTKKGHVRANGKHDMGRMSAGSYTLSFSLFESPAPFAPSPCFSLSVSVSVRRNFTFESRESTSTDKKKTETPHSACLRGPDVGAQHRPSHKPSTQALEGTCLPEQTPLPSSVGSASFQQRVGCTTPSAQQNHVASFFFVLTFYMRTPHTGVDPELLQDSGNEETTSIIAHLITGSSLAFGVTHLHSSVTCLHMSAYPLAWKGSLSTCTSTLGAVWLSLHRSCSRKGWYGSFTSDCSHISPSSPFRWGHVACGPASGGIPSFSAVAILRCTFCTSSVSGPEETDILVLVPRAGLVCFALNLNSRHSHTTQRQGRLCIVGSSFHKVLLLLEIVHLLADPGQDRHVQVVSCPVHGLRSKSLLGNSDTKHTKASGKFGSRPRKCSDFPASNCAQSAPQLALKALQRGHDRRRKQSEVKNQNMCNPSAK